MELKQVMIQVGRTGRNIEVWQKGEGPDLVFLHGAGGLQMWSPDLEELSKSFRVTAPIHPGFGKSEGIDSIDSVLDSVLHTFDVLAELGIRKPHIIGHSMGGMIAAEMAAICPNDVGSIVLVCPVGLWDDAHPVLDFFTLLPVEVVPYVFYDQNHPIAKAMGVTPTNDAAIVDMYVSYIKGLSAAGRLLWPLPDRGLKTRIDRITAPTLILWGEADGLVPVFYAKEFGRRIGGSQVKILKEASHMVLLEKPSEAVSAIKKFLGSAGPSTPTRVASNGAGGQGKKSASAPRSKKKAAAKSKAISKTGARPKAARTKVLAKSKTSKAARGKLKAAKTKPKKAKRR